MLLTPSVRGHFFQVVDTSVSSLSCRTFTHFA